MNLLATIRRFFRKEDADTDMPCSIVLLMRMPFFLGQDALAAPAGRAFGVPYDGSD